MTLIELVVGLVILGLAMAVVLPSVGDWLRNLQVTGAGESMKAGIEKARIEALRRNTSVGFWLVSESGKTLTDACVLSSTGPSYVVAGLDPGSSCGSSPSLTDGPRLVTKWASADGSTGVSLATTTVGGAAGDRVQFDSMGRVLPGDDQLTQIDIVHSGGNARPLRLLIQRGGSVRLCDPNADATDPRRC